MYLSSSARSRLIQVSLYRPGLCVRRQRTLVVPVPLAAEVHDNTSTGPVPPLSPSSVCGRGQAAILALDPTPGPGQASHWRLLQALLQSCCRAISQRPPSPTGVDVGYLISGCVS